MSADILELLHTVEAPPMTVDVEAAMATGRAARTQRRRLLLAGVAATVVIAAGSAVVAGQDRARPANPSPSPTLSTTSAPPRSLTALLDGELAADLDPNPMTITLRRSGGGPGGPSLSIAVPSTPGGTSCRVSPALSVQACAVRAAVRSGIAPYTDPANSEVSPGLTIVGRFSVPDVSVVVVGASAADLPHLRGAAWELDDGTVADSSGTPLLQAHARSVPAAVFVSSLDGSILGIRPDTLGWTAKGPDRQGSTPHLGGGGDPTGDYYAFVLPAAAVSGEVLPTTGQVRTQEVLVLGDRKVLLAQLTGVDHYGRPTARWVDKDGGVHLVRH